MGVCGEDRPRSPDRLPAGGRQAPSALCSVSLWPRARHPGRAAVQGVGRAGRSPFQDQDQHPAPRCVPRSGLRPQALCGSHVVPALGRGRARRLGTGTCWVRSPGGGRRRARTRASGLHRSLRSRGRFAPTTQKGLREGCRPPSRQRRAGKSFRAEIVAASLILTVAGKREARCPPRPAPCWTPAFRTRRRPR